MKTLKYMFKNHCEIETIIPLGEECYTCQTIDSKFNNLQNLRNCAYPFDYVGHTFIETLYKKIENIINTKNVLDKNDIEIKLFGENYYYADKNYKLYYWHDVTYTKNNEFTEEEIDSFIEKYKRRYNRLMKDIETNKKILFISVNNFDNIYNNIYKKDSLLILYNYLHKLNENIVFLAFNYDTENFDYEKLYHIKLEYNKTDSFTDSKNKFQQILYNYINNNILHL